MAAHDTMEPLTPEESAYARPDGLLEHLNLPPQTIRFIRRNQRTIWTCVGVVVVVVVAWALYNQYTINRLNKAASALDQAMQADPAKAPDLLARVAEDFAGTPAARWAWVEQAHLALKADKADEAIALYGKALEEVGKKDPLRPLLFCGLAMAREQKGDLEGALRELDRLQGVDQFAPEALLARGRIEEKLGRDTAALQAYRDYLARLDTQAASGQAGEQPLPLGGSMERDLAQARINALTR